MERLQAYKFQLRPKAGQESLMRRFAGCCRFLWNKVLALEKETYEADGKRLGYYTLAEKLKDWKKEEETAFLSEAHSQILQQTLKDLDRAYKNFFAKRADFPRFKRKGVHDAFRYPQGFKLDEGNSRIFLPKIGWVGYRKSRKIEGTPKQVTVSLSAGKWYVSIQTDERFLNLCILHKVLWALIWVLPALQRSPMAPPSNHCTVSESMKRSWQSCNGSWQNE